MSKLTPWRLIVVEYDLHPELSAFGTVAVRWNGTITEISSNRGTFLDHGDGIWVAADTNQTQDTSGHLGSMIRDVKTQIGIKNRLCDSGL